MTGHADLLTEPQGRGSKPHSLQEKDPKNLGSPVKHLLLPAIPEFTFCNPGLTELS